MPTGPIEAASPSAPLGASSPLSVASDAPSDATRSAAAVASADFETFLSLLTAQMRNQDPLNPMQSTEFVAQLAAFSSVEQQVASNERLDSLAVAMSRSSESGLSAWIGREVQSDAPKLYAGETLSLAAAPPPDAVGATLVVRNLQDDVVARRQVDPAASELTWDGRVGKGAAPHGLYRFELETVDAAGETTASPILTYAQVREVRYGADGVRLHLVGGGETTPEGVRAVRDPVEPRDKAS